MPKKAILILTLLGLLGLPLTLLGVAAVANTALAGKSSTNEPYTIYGPDQAANTLEGIAKLSNDVYPQADKEVTRTTSNPEASDSALAWETEIWAVENSRRQMHGIGPSHHRPIPLLPGERTPNERPFRILIVGDSNTSGSFQDINDNTYVRRLEQKLNQQSPGAYEVVALATDLASFLRQSDWLTTERIKELAPDAIVLTYTLNRIYPSLLENKYCVEFNTCVEDGQSAPFTDAFGHDFAQATLKWRIIMCLRADTTPVSWLFRKVLYPHFSNLAEYLAPRYCTPERVEAGLDLPTDRSGMREDAQYNPYIADFEEYLSSVQQAVLQSGMQIPTYVMNLAWTPDQMWPPLQVDGKTRGSTVGHLFKLYAQYGFEEIPSPITRQTIAQLRTWEVGDIQGVNPGLANNNCVYNCALTEEQWQKNKENYADGTIGHPLKYRPGWAIQESYARDMLAFITTRHPREPTGDPYKQPIVVDYTPWNLGVSNTAGQAVVQFSKLNSANTTTDPSMSDGPTMHTSCVATNHPHAVLALNQARLARAQKLKVSFNGGEYEKLLISFQEEDATGKLSYRASVLLAPGEYFVLDQPQRTRNVLVSDPTRDCTQTPVQLRPFEVSLTLK